VKAGSDPIGEVLSRHRRDGSGRFTRLRLGSLSLRPDGTGNDPRFPLTAAVSRRESALQ